MAAEGEEKSLPFPATPPGPWSQGAQRGRGQGGRITCQLHPVTSGTGVLSLVKSPMRSEKEGPRNPRLILPFWGKRAGISLRCVSMPVLVVGCPRRITLFKCLCSSQGCNYFAVSAAASQIPVTRMAALVPYRLLQCGADDATTIPSAENSHVRQGVLNKPPRRLGTEEVELPVHKMKVVSCFGLAVLAKRG